jgi:hypothetical protein
MNASSHQYRSALALNNMGVRLLEKHCYKAAVETLRESTLLIKAVLKRAALDKDLGSINNTVQMATKRYAQAKPSAKKIIVLQMLTMSNGFLFENSDDGFRLGMCTAVLDDAPSSSVAFPILIEDDSLLEKDSWGDNISDEQIVTLYTQAAIMFHNAAIASRCCHQHKRALRFARIASEIFSQDQVHSPIASLVVHNTLIRCLMDNQCTQEAAERYGDLVEIRAIAHNESSSCDFIDIIATAAAAA